MTERDSLILNRFAASFLVRSYAPGSGICPLDDIVGTAAVYMGISRETGSDAPFFVFTEPLAIAHLPAIAHHHGK